jgi:hypothetical protein
LWPQTKNAGVSIIYQISNAPKQCQCKPLQNAMIEPFSYDRLWPLRAIPPIPP